MPPWHRPGPMPAAGVPRPATEEFRLPNGLSVVLAPDPLSPTASVWLWYRVGSKNEHPGITGASHWVEHMLFQGSPKYPKGAIDRAIVQVGGMLNAFTDADFTAYYATVPREHLGIPHDIEADRLTRATIADEEVDRERSVVLSEREGNENWPEFRVEEELYALAFRQHPYRWEVLGFRRDIEAMDGGHLREYYHRFYGPRNATLVVAGGFDPVAIRAQVEGQFSPLPSRGEDPTVPTVEPSAHGERRTDLHGPGTTPFLTVGYRAPTIIDSATPALHLLDTILGGESRIFGPGAGWGRAREHPNSRLYRALVDTGLAVRATTEWRPRVHPALFVVHAQAANGVSLRTLEEAVHRTTERLARTGPTDREVAEAKVRVRRGAALAYEGATRIGFRLGLFMTLRSLGLEDELFSRLIRVRREAIQAAASALFVADQRSVVRYTPDSERIP